MKIAVTDFYEIHGDLPSLTTSTKEELRKNAPLWREAINQAKICNRQNTLQLNPIIIQITKMWYNDYE